MKRATGLVAAGIAVLALTACTSTVHPAKHPIAASAPAASSKSSAPHYDSAQAIVGKIKAAGLAVAGLKKSGDDTYISEVGGQAYDLQIGQKPGQKIGGSGINLFPNDKALAAWTAISQGMGGIAVVGDTWAVSLSSDSKDRDTSNAMASTIAKALGGTVAR